MRLYSDRLDCYLSGALVLSLARGKRSPVTGRGRVIDYRHFIEALKRKPQAFKGLVFRDALFPREAYRRTWEQLDAKLSQRLACQAIVGLLEMAANDGWRPCWRFGLRRCWRRGCCLTSSVCGRSSPRARPRSPMSRWRSRRQAPMTRCCQVVHG